MTTPWERIDPGFRAYLEAIGNSPAEYNNDSFRRAETFNAYNAFKQQQQQLDRAVTTASSATGVSASAVGQPSHEELIASRSLAIQNAWSSGLPSVPTITELPGVVQSALLAPLPSPLRSTAVAETPADDVVQFSKEDTALSGNLWSIASSIYAAQAFGDNEDSVHSLVDRLVLEPMKVVGESANCAFMMNRNGAGASGATIKSLRPDVLLWIPSGILAFKGEDKATAADRNLARNELLNKLNSFTDTFFGQVPYQLCYNAGGHMLEFVAINRNPVGRPTLHSLAPVIDLSNARGRSLCVRYAVNIARVLVSLSEAFPGGNVVRLGEKIASGSSTVLIMGDYAIKKTNTHSGSVLVELYAQIQQSHPPSLVSSWNEVKISRANALTAHITPVGFCGQVPGDAEEAKKAGRRLLLALSWLHDNGWVHRDVRQSNILFAGGQYYLMDLEWANRIDEPLGHYHPNPDFLPPELVGRDDGIWTVACDMWQFGKLLQHWNSPGILSYVGRQINENPAERLTAKESLGHDFFQQ